MSLWTPGGEHEVPREPSRPASGDAPAAPAGPAGPAADDIFASLPPEVRSQLEALSPAERAEAEAQLREMIEVQEQMASAPAAVVIANHAMGMYELATIHLRQQPPNFADAQLAIDGFAAVVEVLQGKLGPDEATLTDALSQIRLAFVQLSAAVDRARGGEDPAGEAVE